MPDDWELLAQKRAPIMERLEALDRLAGGCTDATARGTALDAFCTAFLDEVVRSGQVKAALDDAARGALKATAVPARPDTAGARAKGPKDLILEPYEARHAIPSAIYILCKRSHETPDLARWLFEAAKLYAYERRQALAGLAQGRVEPAVLADGIESLATFAAAQPDPGGDILRDTAQTWIDRPAWLLALIDRVALDRAAAGVLADGLYGDDFSGAPAQPSTDDAARRAWLAHATGSPSGARAVALGVLATFAGDGGLEAAILAALDDRGAHLRVVEAAARLALARRVWSRAVHDAAERRLAAVGESYGRLETAAAEALAALLGSCAAALAPPPSETSAEGLAIVEGPFFCHELAFVGPLAVTAYRRALVAAPMSDWRTDEDEIGLAVAGPGTAARRVAPVRFAARPTGASGARRKVELAGVLDGRALLVIQSPFSDGRGWGTDNYALGCDPATGAWVAYREEGGVLVVARELEGGAPIDEGELPQISYGEAIVWVDGGRARVVADGTPYHLDDYEIDDAVTAAHEAQRTARSRPPWTVYAPDRGPWTTPAAAAELAAAWPAFVPDALPAAAIAQGDSLALLYRLDTPAMRAGLVWRAGR